MTETAAVPAPTGSQKFTAEVVGTFVLVFFGVGTAVGTGGEVVTTGLAFGLTVVVMAYAVGRVSGGHFNPAVTLGAVIGGRLAWAQAGMYILAQLIGGLLGGGVLWLVWQGIPGFSSEGSFGQNAFGDQSANGIAWWAAFLVEAVATMIFLLVILSVTDERNEHPGLAPLAIGLSLAMIHFALIPLTGTSVNPARSIGSAVFAGSDAILQLWVFILAPLVGGAVAGAAYAALFGRGANPVVGSGFRFRRTPPGAVPGYGAPDAYQQQWNQQQYAPGPPQGGQQWPPQPPHWQQQPQYPTGGQPPRQPGQQGWPQQPVPPQQGQPPQGQPPQQGQAWPPQQQPPWPGGDDDGQTQVRPPT
ncbi:MAG: MIP family channel protein [Nocardioides sp.]